jgi:hypothetical protein
VPGPVSTLRACAALVALQAIGLAAAAVFIVVELIVSSSDDPVRAVVSGLLALAAAVGLGLVARGLLAGRRWARAPALVTNLILLPVAYGLLQADVWYAGIPLLLWALAVLVLLFAPSTSAALDDN